MKVIAVMNQKGGVGKTATALNLIREMQREGLKVLAVDLDPQRGNLSQTIHADKDMESMYEVLAGEATLADTIQTTDLFDLAPATLDMANIDIKLNSNGGAGRERRLKKALQSLPEGAYDYVVIDTPPALNLLTMNAMVAADYILVVAEPDVNALNGIVQLNEMIQEVRENYNPDLAYAGILMTKYEKQTNIAQDMRGMFEQVAAQMMGTKVFDTTIRKGVAVPMSLANATDVRTQDSSSGPAADYKNFAAEFLHTISAAGKKV